MGRLNLQQLPFECRAWGFTRKKWKSNRLFWKDSAQMINSCLKEFLNLPNDLECWTDDSFKNAMDFLNGYIGVEKAKEIIDDIVEDNYSYACSQLEIGQLDKALAVFNRIANYRDCSEEIRHIKERRIRKAILLYSKNENEKANRVISQILSWGNYSQEQKDRCLQLVDDSKDEAIKLFQDSKQNEAVELFAKFLLDK